jgi:prepilin-type N-terminal cleavage/methylation domain-containing protein
MKNRKGFTLIEVLIVIGVLAILASIVALSVNPASQFNRANDSVRRSDVQGIMSGIFQYSVDNAGDLSGLVNLGGSELEICKLGRQEDCDAATDDFVELEAELVSDYMSTIPEDPGCSDCPSCDDDNGTGYWITEDASTGAITIEAKCISSGTFSITQ